jgi:FemAB family protein
MNFRAMIKEKLTQIIQGLTVDVSTNVEEWQSVLNQCKVVPSTCYLLSSTQYYVAYYLKNNAINFSLVLHLDKQAVGIMPLMIHQNERFKWVLSSNGVEIVEPIFIPTLAPKVKKRLESQLARVIFALSSVLSIVRCQFVNMEYDRVTSWYLMWANKASEVFSTHHLLVDLSLPLKDIRLKFRKSYRSLVNKDLRGWRVEVHEQVSDETFEQFRLLHQEVVGGITRSIESWNEQRNQIDTSESFLVTVSDENESLVGAGLFVCSPYQGTYSVGAYKRELFDKPIGHPIQLKAIETLKKKGVLWYEIGQKHLKVDKGAATEKELSISQFKEGFSTHVIARQHLIVQL